MSPFFPISVRTFCNSLWATCLLAAPALSAAAPADFPILNAILPAPQVRFEAGVASSPAATAAEPASYAQSLKLAAVEHAPLAFFSLGSLAIGGVFYSIDRSTRHTNTSYTAEDGRQITAALGVAGLTALLAAGAYCYYVRQSAEASQDWNASVSGGVSPSGDLNVGALLTLPLPVFSR
jgi:hypothetical protein